MNDRSFNCFTEYIENFEILIVQITKLNLDSDDDYEHCEGLAQLS